MTRNQRRPKQEKEIKTMNKPNILKFTLVLAFVVASASLIWSQDRQSGQLPNSMNTIVGVWEGTRHGVNCDDPNQQLGPSFPALMTFHQDGTVSGQSYGPFPENAYGSGEFGVWQHGAGNTFSYRLLSYLYEDSGQLNGSIVVTATGQLTSADSFSYDSTVEIYDADGNLLATHCGRATATRFE
jgi:hypothetical protein